jgi:myo-inositol-1(or 4)-monophosphatase
VWTTPAAGLSRHSIFMLEDVITAVREVAASAVMPQFLKTARSRKHDGSLCTSADIAAQAALKTRLKTILDCPIMGEEMLPEEQQRLWRAGEDALWCVDPIDGTSNFVNGLPYFAISVALMKNRRSVLGVVYAPYSDEMFCAESGRGASLNGESLPLVTHNAALRGAVAGVDFKRLPRALACDLARTPPYSSQRNFGSSSLEWCYTAAGRFDVYLHGGQKLWDYAAGALILQEAGGAVCTLENDDFWASPLWQRSVVAALDAELLHAWCSWIRAHLPD